MKTVRHIVRKLVAQVAMWAMLWNCFAGFSTSYDDSHHDESHEISELMSIFLGGGSHTHSHTHDDEENHNDTPHFHLDINSVSFVVDSFENQSEILDINVLETAIHRTCKKGHEIVISLFRPPKSEIS